MYTENSRGPFTEPCGTPYSTALVLEFTVSLDCVSDLTGRIYDAQAFQPIQEEVIIYGVHEDV